MRHEEENHWHPSDRHHPDNRRERHRHQGDKNINDFGSRWGEPDPRFSPRSSEWQQDENYHRDNRRNDPEADWAPFERQIEQHRRQQRHDGEQHREPEWRQRDRHFNSSNQHANDRWSNGNNMPRPNQDRDRDRQRYQEEEHRRRRNRDYRED